MLPLAIPLDSDGVMPTAPVPRLSADVEHPIATGDRFDLRLVSAGGSKRAPDPPRPGDTAVRRARFWRSFTLRDMSHEEEALGVVAGHGMIPVRRSVPRGRLLPWQERTNIYRAPYQTYSELVGAEAGVAAPGL